jgi:hypothetical protein
MGSFKYLRDRLWKFVQGWMELLLSLEVKEVLIKELVHANILYVLLQTPNRTMPIFGLGDQKLLVGMHGRKSGCCMGILGLY